MSLDSGSLSVPNPETGKTDRIDLPMRAFSGGFYNNLKTMYDYLGVQYRPQRFLFGFSTIAPKLSCKPKTAPQERLHFVHSSNNHILFPMRPHTATFLSHLIEVLYLIVWYAWFTICCFLVAPFPHESFRSYVQRIYLPSYFVSSYLLPLFCSVATCPHDELMEFPAHDLIDYKKRTNGDQHYTVHGGVSQVQTKLTEGLNVRKSAKVISVEPQTQGTTRVRWENTLNNPKSTISEAIFDKVILAVPPNVVQAIFKPLEYEMSQIPTIPVQSIVHADETSLGRITGTIQHSLSAKTVMKGSEGQIIYLRTFAGKEPQTESIHIQPSGLLVTTCPVSVIDPAKTKQSTTFTRVLRTPKSRQILRDVFDRSSPSPSAQALQEKSKTQWRNGDEGVWLVGGWCWDGMVLLEGCIVSSMVVAKAFGVEIPWL